MVAVATLLTVLVNLTVDLIPLGGITTAKVSDIYFTFFTPAGITFAIWGVIYAGLTAYAIYFLRFKSESAEKLEKTFWWYVFASLANVIWLICWHYQQVGLSTVFMGALLVSLIMIYLEVNKPTKLPQRFAWMVRVPVSIYLGWISVATIANIASALVQVSWLGFGLSAETWSAILIGVATGLGLAMTKFRKDFFFVGVLVWALIGIGANFYTSSPMVFGAVIVALFALLAQVTFTAIGRFFN